MTKSMRPHETATSRSKYFEEWDAKLERLYRGCKIVVTAFDPGVSGYVVESGAHIEMTRALHTVVDDLVCQLHPEWSDDKAMSCLYHKRTAQKFKTSKVVQSKTKRLGKDFRFGGQEGQYIVSGTYRKCYVYAVGRTPQEAYDKAVDQIKRYKALIKDKATPYYWTYDNPKV